MPLIVAGKGETMAEARAQAYGRIDDVIVPNVYYRDDVGERWIEGDGDRLQAWGYLGPTEEATPSSPRSWLQSVERSLY